MNSHDDFSLVSSNSMPSNHDDEGPILVFGIEYIPTVPKAIFIPSDSFSSLPDVDYTEGSSDDGEILMVDTAITSGASRGSNSKGSAKKGLGRKLRKLFRN